jgi:hypothetical protein
MHIEVIQTDNHLTGAGQMSTPLVAPAISNAWRSCQCAIAYTPFTSDRVKALAKDSDIVRGRALVRPLSSMVAVVARSAYL